MIDSDALYIAFGNAVAEQRKRKEMTQAEIASFVGLSRGAIAHIENGSRKVFLHQALAIADALGLDSSHDLIPSNAGIDAMSEQADVKISGKHRLNANQKAQVRSVVGYARKSSEEE